MTEEKGKCVDCGKDTKVGKDGVPFKRCFTCNKKLKEKGEVQTDLKKAPEGSGDILVRVPKDWKSLRIIHGD